MDQVLQYWLHVHWKFPLIWWLQNMKLGTLLANALSPKFDGTTPLSLDHLYSCFVTPKRVCTHHLRQLKTGCGLSPHIWGKQGTTRPLSHWGEDPWLFHFLLAWPCTERVNCIAALPSVHIVFCWTPLPQLPPLSTLLERRSYPRIITAELWTS